MPSRPTILLFLVLITLAISIHTIHYDFVWDDTHLIVDNESLQSAAIIKEAFTSPFLGQHYYRPLVTLSFAIDRQLWDLDPRGFHLTNIVIHICAVLMVFLLFQRISRQTVVPALGAFIFAVHPVHAENIAFISARTDTFSVFFFLCAWHLHLNGLNRRKSFLWITGAYLAFLCALLSKEMAASLPIVIVLHDWWSKKFYASRRIYAGYFIILILFLCVRTVVLEELSGKPWSPALLYNAPLIMMMYLRRLLMPLDLYVLYKEVLRPSLTDPLILLSLGLLILLITVLRYGTINRQPYAWGMGFYFVTSLPILQFIPFSPVMAERFLYLPSIGFCYTAAALLTKIAEQWTKQSMIRGRIAAIVIICFLTIQGWVTVVRCEIFKDNMHLWSYLSSVYPDDHELQYNLGNSFYTNGHYQKAIELYHNALLLNPGDTSAQKNLALAYYHSGQFHHSIPLLLGLFADRQEPEVGYYLAQSYEKTGAHAAAESYFRKTIALQPTIIEAYQDYSQWLYNRKRYEETAVLLDSAITYFADAGLYFQLGLTRLQLQQITKAISAWQTASTLQPDFIPIYRNLASAYAYLGQHTKAIDYWKKYLHKDPEYTPGYKYLSEQYRATGKSDSAAYYHILYEKRHTP